MSSSGLDRRAPRRPRPAGAPRDSSLDPAIAEAVDGVTNRFRAQGLEQMIAYAEPSLADARAALEELAEVVDQRSPLTLRGGLRPGRACDDPHRLGCPAQAEGRHVAVDRLVLPGADQVRLVPDAGPVAASDALPVRAPRAQVGVVLVGAKRSRCSNERQYCTLTVPIPELWKPRRPFSGRR